MRHALAIVCAVVVGGSCAESAVLGPHALAVGTKLRTETEFILKVDSERVTGFVAEVAEVVEAGPGGPTLVRLTAEKDSVSASGKTVVSPRQGLSYLTRFDGKRWVAEGSFSTEVQDEIDENGEPSAFDMPGDYPTDASRAFKRNVTEDGMTVAQDCKVEKVVRVAGRRTARVRCSGLLKMTIDGTELSFPEAVTVEDRDLEWRLTTSSTLTMEATVNGAKVVATGSAVTTVQ